VVPLKGCRPHVGTRAFRHLSRSVGSRILPVGAKIRYQVSVLRFWLITNTQDLVPKAGWHAIVDEVAKWAGAFKNDGGK